MATIEKSRDELVAEYVRRESVALVVSRIAGLGVESSLLERISEEIDRNMLVELWPGTDPDDDPQFEAAHVEICTRAAHLMFAIAASGDHFAREARRLAEVAESDGRKLHERETSHA